MLPWEPSPRGIPAHPAGWRPWPVNTGACDLVDLTTGCLGDSTAPRESKENGRGSQEPSPLWDPRTYYAVGLWALLGN